MLLTGLCNVMRGVGAEVLWQVIPKNQGKVVEGSVRYFASRGHVGSLKRYGGRTTDYASCLYGDELAKKGRLVIL